MATNKKKEHALPAAVEKHDTAAWADQEKTKKLSKVSQPSERDVRHAGRRQPKIKLTQGDCHHYLDVAKEAEFSYPPFLYNGRFPLNLIYSIKPVKSMVYGITFYVN